MTIEYRFEPGDGILAVRGDVVLFVADASHSATQELLDATSTPHVLRSLAAVVVQHSFEIPSFVALEKGDPAHGMAFGDVVVNTSDAAVGVVDASGSTTWSEFSAGRGSSIAVGAVPQELSFVVSDGVVPARAFATSSDAGLETGVVVAPDEAVKSSESSDPQRRPEQSSDAEREPVEPAASAQELDPLPPPPPAAPVPEVAATTAAVPSADPRPSIPLEEIMRGGAEPSDPRDGDGGDHIAADPEPAPDIEPTVDAADDAPGSTTIDVPEGVVLLPSDEDGPEIEARLCQQCQEVNPPSAARCRGCNDLLSDANSLVTRVVRPSLGTIELSDGTSRRLTTSLILGRNPEREPLGPDEDGVVIGVGDRSVSRRHVEVRLVEWNVEVSDLGTSHGTRIERSAGGPERLTPGVPVRLGPGDEVHFGGAWFRYEVDGGI